MSANGGSNGVKHPLSPSSAQTGASTTSSSTASLSSPTSPSARSSTTPSLSTTSSVLPPSSHSSNNPFDDQNLPSPPLSATDAPLNPFLYDEERGYESSEGEEEDDEDGEEEEEEGEEEDGEEEPDDEPEHEADDSSHSLSSSIPLSSLLTSLSPSCTLPPDFCDLTGTWRVDRSTSDSLSPLLAALSVPPSTRLLIDSMEVTTSIHHDPLQHTLTIIDQSAAGQHVTTLYTDGVVRSTVDKTGKVLVRRAFEEEEEDDEVSAESKEKRHPLRGGVVRVETHLSDSVEMVDTRVLIERDRMMQQTLLIKEGKIVCKCRRFYQRAGETDEERERGEKVWKEKLEITKYMRQAKKDGVHADEGEEGAYDEADEGEDETGEDEREETEEGHMEGTEELDDDEEDEEDDDSQGVSSTSASPEQTPSNSPVPRPSTLPPPPPPPDFSTSMNGTWSVLKQHSQDVSPILKKMGVSWMDRSMSSNQDQLVMNVGRSILVCVDRSQLGVAELRYVCDSQWHDGMSFGGKEGRVRVILQKEKLPFSISIETCWLKDKRSKFQQLVEPSPHSLAYDPARGNRSMIPIGFVVCKLIDVRVLERRAIVKQMLQYVENEAVRLVCVRYLRKIETREEKRKGEEQERARQEWERMRCAYERSIDASHTSSVKQRPRHKIKRKKKQHAEEEAERIERLMNVEETKPASPLRYAGAYRRMSSSSGFAPLGGGREDDVREPNPLLTFLPIRLVLAGGRGGQLYLLMSFLLLACWCLGNSWATVTLILMSAFYLHYLEVVGRTKSSKLGKDVDNPQMLQAEANERKTGTTQAEESVT